jgi:hypothetical protein
VARRVGLEQGVVDHRGDALGRAARRVQAEARRAGVEHAAQPIRAALVHDRVAGAPAWRRRLRRGDFLDDDANQPLQLDGVHHERADRSRSRILASRRM